MGFSKPDTGRQLRAGITRPVGAELLTPEVLIEKLEAVGFAACAVSGGCPAVVRELLQKISKGQCVDERKCCLAALRWLDMNVNSSTLNEHAPSP
jgi:hypothetical protein